MNRKWSARSDLTLAEKLAAEREGILAWILQGAVAWYRQGLGVPEDVRSATTGYRASMDDMADFLTDRCIVEDGTAVGSRALYEAYKDWSEGARRTAALGEDVLHQSGRTRLHQEAQ